MEPFQLKPEREVWNPQIHLLHLPQHLSRLEARKTDNDNAKLAKKKDRRQHAIVCSLSLATLCSNGGGGKAGFPLTRMEPSCHRPNKAIFSLHNRAAAASHTFLMAEISHALTDLSRSMAIFSKG